MRTIEIRLPCFNQGCELHAHVKEDKNYLEAFSNYAKSMREESNRLFEIMLIFRKHIHHMDDVSIETDSHMIRVTGPRQIAEELLHAKLGVEIK